MKRLQGNRILDNCGQCSLKINLLPEKGLGHLGYKCSKLQVNVDSDTIHPSCRLPEVEVINGKDLFTIHGFPSFKHLDTDIMQEDIEKILIIKKPKESE
jgi:hypothetical protein